MGPIMAAMILGERSADELIGKLTVCPPILKPVASKACSLPAAAASFRLDTISKGAVDDAASRKNASSTMMLPDLTDTITIRLSGISSKAARPTMNERR
jgi:hypothetical protein